MMNSKSYHPSLRLFLTALFLGGIASAADWPTYRHDNARTGCTTEVLEGPLTLQWVYSPPHPPRPAWSGPASRPREGFYLRHRVIFDDAFQVSVVGDTLYFGSSSDNKIYALDAATGRQRWSFFTGGPVRLAPTVWKGRVYVGSDDGFVYCLNAEDGKLLWKLRGGPNGEKLLGNGKMISRWPIRTGVLVYDGIAYFGAGIFPHENVYLYAVKADDGTIVWKNDTISERDAYRNEFSPQGYMLATDTHLFVPSGRGLPVGFIRATGTMVFAPRYGWRGQEAGGPIGGTYALLADDQIYTGTQQHLVTLDQKTGRTGFGWFPGRRLAVVGDMAYLATGSEIVAMDRSGYARASRKRHSLEYKIKTLRTSLRGTSGKSRQKIEQQLKAAEQELERHNSQNIAPTIRWKVSSQSDAELILCGSLVFAGGEGYVEALDRENGKLVWNTKVDGKARGLAVANGRLYVSTDTGKIYCFASRKLSPRQSQPQLVSSPRVENPYPHDKLTELYKAAAESIVAESGVTKGYCLVIGAEYGRLAYELAKRTSLVIVGIEPDIQKVRAARKALDAAGLYGERVIIDQGELSELPYSNYFANLIVSDSLLLTGEIPGKPRQIVRHLKPCGGVICLGVPANAPGQAKKLSAENLSEWMTQLELGGCRLVSTNGLWATLRRGPLPGAGKWTHQYAEPGNTACSDDKILAGPLGLLWFGEPGPASMVNRHDAATAPLAVNGRLFIQGENVLMAYDSYNGTLLWERKIHGAIRTRLKGRECSNLAASDDSFFVAVGDKCLRLDAATGKTLAAYDMPVRAGTKGRKWGYVAYVAGILYGSAMSQTGLSDSVFAIDTRTGRTLWTYDGKSIGNLTIAIGDGWLFLIDSSLSPDQRKQLLSRDKSHLMNLSSEQAKKAEAELKKIDARLAVALDARTGGKLWQRPVDVTDCSRIGIGGGELTAMYHDGVLLLCGANANGHYWRQFLKGEFSRRRLVALSARDGSVLWAKDANYRHRPIIIGETVYAEPWAFDLKTGEQRMRRHPLTGKQTIWQFLRPGHHCGAISACPQMLLMRSGFTSYYDLLDDSGIRHFAGHRLGCWINAIAADGLALAPEASAGCVCLFPIVCTVVLEPRPDHQRWAIYSARGDCVPVQHMALNLGAPGDRRDAAGTLWLAYPRPGLPADRAEMGFKLRLKTEFLARPDYYCRNSDLEVAGAADVPWVFTCCARGLRRCVVPLLGDGDRPTEYTVGLYFADFENDKPAKRVFDVKLQGKLVLDDLDIAKETGGRGKALIRWFRGVRVSRDLEIELLPHEQGGSSSSSAPLLCGLEIIQEPAIAGGATAVHARR